MKLKLFVTIVTTKILIIICRILKHGGTTLPGKVARIMFPNILDILSSDLTIIFITGTNGKSTTLRIIAKILEENKIKYISNKSGANLIAGIFSTFIGGSRLDGSIDAKAALIEIDEATFPIMADYLNPNILIVTNFFSDQSDRYGNVHTPVNRVKDGISKCKDTSVILNADDPLCASLSDAVKGNVVFYGFDSSAFRADNKAQCDDIIPCINCNNRYEYTFGTYNHLGEYYCPSCGYKRPSPDVCITDIHELNSEYSKVSVKLSDNMVAANDANSIFDAAINLPGLYNIYNALPAVACGLILNIPLGKIINGVAHFENAFGRMETIKSGDKTIKLILVKNAVGCNQVLDYLLTDQNQCIIAFAINDKIADGTDISWIWDVDFEKFCTVQNKVTAFITSGTRTADIAVRLKYAGIAPEKIAVMNDYHSVIDISLQLLKHNQTLYLLPNYTALFDIRKHLGNKFKINKFWE